MGRFLMKNDIGIDVYQLIDRVVRELGVKTKLFPLSVPADELLDARLRCLQTRL